MNIDETEIYFKKYNEMEFHMSREEPVKYNLYKNLNISSDLKEHWRQELIQSCFDSFFEDAERIWLKHNNIIDLIFSTKTNINNNILNLLNYMKKIVSLDEAQQIYIIQNMGGRKYNLTDGDCYLICTHTNFAIQMNNIMEKIINLKCDANNLENVYNCYNTPQIFLDAVNSYRMAYQRFSNQYI